MCTRLRRLAAVLAAAFGLLGCRTATTLQKDRDLYAEAARAPEARAPQVVISGWCGDDAAAHLRKTLAARPRSAEPPDLVVEGGAVFDGTRSIGTGEAIAFYTYDFIMAFPGLVLPVPMPYGGEYTIRLVFVDRETGLARGTRVLKLVHKGTTYWVWGLMGVRTCRPSEFEPLAVWMIEEESRRLSQLAEQRAFLTSTREAFARDRAVLQALASGKDPRGPPPAPALPKEPTLADVAHDPGWDEQVPGSGLVRSKLDARLTLKDHHRLDPATGKPVVESSGSGHAAVHWVLTRYARASVGQWDYRTEVSTAERLYTSEYDWVHPTRSWRRVGVTPAPAAIQRALEENEVALRRIDARLAALPP